MALPDGSPIADDPHNGGDVLSSVRFARGMVDGAEASLLLRAARRPSGAGPSVPTAAVFEMYQLVPRSVGAETRDEFVPILRRELRFRFCNADLALSVASGLPLRSSYRGPRGADGQFTSNGCPDTAIARR